MAERVVGFDPRLDDVPEEELDTAMDDFYGVHMSAHAQLLAVIASVEKRSKDRKTIIVGVSARLGVTIAVARRWVDTAALVRNLPHLAELYMTGKLSFEKLEAIAKIAMPETDEELAAKAMTLSTAELRRIAQKLTAVKDPNPPHADRHLDYRFSRDGSRFTYSGAMSGDEGIIFVTALEREMGRMPWDPEIMTTYTQRASDALLNLVRVNISEDPDADRATVIVHTDASVLTGGIGITETELGVPLHPDTARRLACDSRMQIAKHDKTGRLIDLGRTQRTFPPWLLRQIKHRDKCCVFPGCNNRRFVQGHHVTFWPDGGQTNMDDGCLLCTAHHRLVHEGHWRVELLDGDTGATRWFKPDGTVYTGGPPELDEELYKRLVGPLVPV